MKAHRVYISLVTLCFINSPSFSIYDVSDLLEVSYETAKVVVREAINDGYVEKLGRGRYRVLGLTRLAEKWLKYIG